MIHVRIVIPYLIFLFTFNSMNAQNRMRDFGILIGVMKTGELNSITDVEGVKVGHYTLKEKNNIRTGVTAILPHSGNIFQEKVPAAIYIGNGFGKLAGYSQVEELGNIETPIILTNTLSVPTAADAVIDYILNLPGNENVRSVNPVVGETNDGWLNDIRGRHIKKEYVISAISNAKSGPVEEGCVGAGTGTICFSFKGGIGTASRIIPESLGGFTVGVLVQSNFGGVLKIDGVPLGEKLKSYYLQKELNEGADGSCMIIVATDAPITSHNLKRLAKRAMLGLAKTGGISSNGSGDYVIAFSTAEELRVGDKSNLIFNEILELRNDAISPLFMAVIEATEEAILNSLFTAETTTGRDSHRIEKLPVDKVLKIMSEYKPLN